jgi:hypothetical protein
MIRRCPLIAKQNEARRVCVQIRKVSPQSQNCGILYGMGNKDKGRREVKKPKKQVPKPEPSRPAITFVNKPTGTS